MSNWKCLSDILSIAEQIKISRSVFKECDNQIMRNQSETIEIMKRTFSEGVIENNLITNSKPKKESTMIPFDSERALSGDKVITVNFETVYQLKEFVLKDDDNLLVGVVNDQVCYLQASHLRMAPKKLSGFINVYADGMSSDTYITKSNADKGISLRGCARVACIDLSQHEEGEGI